jgi:hypothetical protein
VKVGDLVKFKNAIGFAGRVFLIARTEMEGISQKVWIYPDPEPAHSHFPNNNNYYFAFYFEVISESR